MIKSTSISKTFLSNIVVSFIIQLYIISALIYQQHLVENARSVVSIFMVLGFTIILYYAIKIIYLKSITISNSSYRITLLLLSTVLLHSAVLQLPLLTGALFVIPLSVAISVYINNDVAHGNLLVPFWFLFSYVLYRLILNPDPNMVFINSRNYISFYLIVTIAPYYYSKLSKKLPLSIIPAMLTLLLSVYSLGRSGILSSSLIVIAILLTRVKVKKYSVILYVILGVMVVKFGENQTLVQIAATDMDRFASIDSFLEAGLREIMWLDYLSQLSAVKVLFGLDMDEFMLAYTNGHIHNSFIKFHSAAGIGALVFISVMIFKMKKHFTYNFPLFIFFTAIVIRLSTDDGALFGYFDYVIWMIMIDLKPKNPSGKFINNDGIR